MPRSARQPAESGIYHVMLRGVNRDAIFLDAEDRERFLRALTDAKEASGCLVFAYCLMDNHVHLVLRATGEPVGVVVKRLGVRYVGWFNRKYGRVGHLYQSRFSSRPVDDDAYLVALLRYVWLNPVKAGLVARPEEYPWSSRRLVGRPSPLLDERPLRKLLPGGSLEDLATGGSRPADVLIVDPDPPRHTDTEAAELLRRACGAGGPGEFHALGALERQAAIRVLRTQSVPYAQIARITGISATSVRRVQVAELPPDRSPA